MRKHAAVLAVIGLFFGGLATSSCTKEVGSSAEYQHFETLEEMWTRANLVIEGRLGTDPEITVLSGNDYPHRVHEVEVLEVWKGSAKVGEVIEVKELASVSYGGVRYNVDDEAPLTAGGSYLLFLDDFPCYEGHTPAGLLNPRESQYALADGKFVTQEGNSFEVSASELERLAHDPSLVDESWSRC